MGRNRLSVFQLHWKEVHGLQNSCLQNIIQSYVGVFKEGFSTLKGFEAKIYVEDGAKPHFTTSRSAIEKLRTLFFCFGFREQVITNNGRNVVSTEFEEFLRQNGNKHYTPAPYH